MLLAWLRALGSTLCRARSAAPAARGMTLGGEPSVVAVIGCTGTGKSKLAVELAHHVEALAAQGRAGRYRRAEVISADSMQVYQGLDVITNKATRAEMDGIPHHLMSFRPPGDEAYTIREFTAQAGALMSKMQAAEQAVLPIVAGGTSYYVQHLLFPGRLVSAEEQRQPREGAESMVLSPRAQAAVAELPEPLQHIWQGYLSTGPISSPELPPLPQDAPSSQQLWTLLNGLDPAMAARWHPNDQRKILRSLTVFATTGTRHSDWVLDQDEEERNTLGTASDDGASLSAPSSLRRIFFWVWCEPSVLKNRLDQRIHKMVQSGLLNEIRELKALATSLYGTAGPDYTQGIFQAIGFKEFDALLAYLEAESSGVSCTEQVVRLDNDARGRKLFDSAVESMQIGTRQYARRQTSWIRNKLLPEIKKARMTGHTLGRSDVEIYLLDATDLEHWQSKVAEPAKDILERFLRGQDLPEPVGLSAAAADQLSKVYEDDDDQALGLGSEESKLSSMAFVPCPICSPSDSAQPAFLVRASDMEGHRQSRRHRMALKRLARRQEPAPEATNSKARSVASTTGAQLDAEEQTPHA